jgi:hypothetical protein
MGLTPRPKVEKQSFVFFDFGISFAIASLLIMENLVGFVLPQCSYTPWFE